LPGRLWTFTPRLLFLLNLYKYLASIPALFPCKEDGTSVAVAGDAYISVFIKSGANLFSKLFEVSKMYLREKIMQFFAFKPWF
jgi:hypothetical protein